MASSTVAPPRFSLSATPPPARRPDAASMAAFAEATDFPSIAMMTSPGFTPARAAGEPSRTEATVAVSAFSSRIDPEPAAGDELVGLLLADHHRCELGERAEQVHRLQLGRRCLAIAPGGMDGSFGS